MKCVGMRCSNTRTNTMSPTLVNPDFSSMMFKQKEPLDDRSNNLRGIQ